MYTRLLEPDQISHTQSMMAERGHTNLNGSLTDDHVTRLI